eukprot:3266031-Pyramimonas_sp.AAC.1
MREREGTRRNAPQRGCRTVRSGAATDAPGTQHKSTRRQRGQTEGTLLTATLEENLASHSLYQGNIAETEF